MFESFLEEDLKNVEYFMSDMIANDGGFNADVYKRQVVGAAASVTLTATTAFVLSRKRFFLRRQLSLLMTLTMFISGGLVPLYILVQKMHLYNTCLLYTSRCV